MSGIVFDIMRYSVHDGPGIRTTVFLKGCPLRCEWCHNPESLAFEPEPVYRHDRCLTCLECVPACREGAIAPGAAGVTTDVARCVRCGACVAACPADARDVVGREMDVAGVLREIEKDVPFFDESGGGVTFSGGEPLAQAEFLAALLEASRARRIHTSVDTSGLAPTGVVERIGALADLFLFDIKAIDPARHRALTGVPNERILANLAALAGAGRAVVVRMPIVPGRNDAIEEIRAAGEFLAGVGLKDVQLLPYHATARAKYERLGRPDPMAGAVTAPAQVDLLVGELRRLGLVVTVGG